MHLDAVAQDLGVDDLPIHELDDQQHGRSHDQAADVAVDHADGDRQHVRDDGTDVGDQVADAGRDADDRCKVHAHDRERDAHHQSHQHGIDELPAHVARERKDHVGTELGEAPIAPLPHQGAQHPVPIACQVGRVHHQIDREDRGEQRGRGGVAHGRDALRERLAQAVAIAKDERLRMLQGRVHVIGRDPQRRREPDEPPVQAIGPVGQVLGQ